MPIRSTMILKSKTIGSAKAEKYQIKIKTNQNWYYYEIHFV